MSSWLVHFENTKIVRTFWLQVTNSWNSWFISLFASWFVVASKPNTPFSGNIVSSWLRALMQQTQAPHLFLNIVCSWVHMLHTQPSDFWHGLVTSCVMNASRLIFSTSSWLRVLQTQPPDFLHGFVTSWVRVLSTQTSWFSARVREFVWSKHNRLHFGTSSWGFVSSCVVNTNRLIFSMSAWLRQVTCCQHKLTAFS